MSMSKLVYEVASLLFSWCFHEVPDKDVVKDKQKEMILSHFTLSVVAFATTSYISKV